MACLRVLKVWCPDQWQSFAAPQGPALVNVFEKFGYDNKIHDMIAAYKANPSVNLQMMKEATGNIDKSTDINYIWTSDGIMALMLEPGRNKEDIPKEFEDLEEFVKYDLKLRAWVADLSIMHTKLMTNLTSKLNAMKANGADTETIEKEIKEFDVANICEDGNWANGIALSPFPKFFVVTKWIKHYYPTLFDMANKMMFFKVPGIKAPPFIQIRKHRTCIFFKGRNGPGSVFVNPEFADGENQLPNDLPDEVYNEMQFTVEIIGGKSTEFPNGLTGKITCINDELFVIPVAPAMTKRFDPYGMLGVC